MSEFTQNPLFGVMLGVTAFAIGQFLNSKTKSPLCNPLVIAFLLIWGFLTCTGIPVAHFSIGGELISFFLLPATACLGFNVYRMWKVLKENWLPVVLGCTVGSLVSISSGLLLCKCFGLSEVIAKSVYAKCVTTPIAMAISTVRGGEPSLTAATVCMIGIFGALASPLLIRLFRVKNPIAQGVAIGTSSHAIGTTKAMEMGETQGALSSVAISISAVVTVLFSMFI